MLRTIDANTEQRKASELARYGARYYPVDPTYDKRVYENSCGNYVKIILCLFAFWSMNALHWWGVFSLGVVETDILAWYSIGCWAFTVIFLGGLLCQGRNANKLKRQHEFYVEKISENRALQQEAETKKLQEEIHARKVEEHNRKLAEIAAQEAAKAPQQQQQQMGQAPATQMYQQQQYPVNIQDQRLIQPESRH